jgi:NAD-dependent SIR2 family protein deacetylase
MNRRRLYNITLSAHLTTQPLIANYKHQQSSLFNSMSAPAPHNDISAFHTALQSSRRILALCGAGLSASSGLPTFRGAGGFWRNHDATELATPGAFARDPGLVWLFYAYRRHMSLTAQPNDAHRALAKLAKVKEDKFLCLTQNVDST